MSFEVFMQVRCLQKSKWRWNRGNKGAKMHKQSSQWNFAPWTHSVRIFRTVTVHGAKRSILDDSHDSHFWSTCRSPFRAYHMLFQSFGSQESIASNGAQFGFETEKLWPFEDDCANHERKCRASILLLLDTFLKHFLKLKLCIWYLVSKIGKSGVQCFKRYVIWIWNEEVMVVWRRLCKAERKCCSRTPIGHILITSRSSFYAYHMSFQSSGSQESISSSGTQFGVEMKKLWPFEDDYAKLKWKCCSRTKFCYC